MAVVRAKHLRWLGLRSLKEVSAGLVMVRGNPELCYTREDLWIRLFRTGDQKVTLRSNAAEDVCGETLTSVSADGSDRGGDEGDG